MFLFRAGRSREIRLYRSIKDRRRERVVHGKANRRSCCTGWLVGVLSLEGTGGGLLVGRLSGDLEGDTVGGLALHLKGGSGDMVEVLVQQLYRNISLLDPQHKSRRHCLG